MASAETTVAAELLAKTRDGALLYGLTPPRGSLTNRKVEIDASIDLVREIRSLLA